MFCDITLMFGIISHEKNKNEIFLHTYRMLWMEQETLSYVNYYILLRSVPHSVSKFFSSVKYECGFIFSEIEKLS